MQVQEEAGSLRVSTEYGGTAFGSGVSPACTCGMNVPVEGLNR